MIIDQAGEAQAAEDRAVSSEAEQAPALAAAEPPPPSPDLSGLPERTGDERVDAALGKLATVAQLPLAAAVTVFDDVHRLLQDALSDNGQGGLVRQ